MQRSSESIACLAAALAQAQAELQAAGYVVGGTGIADATNYAATVVYYSPGSVDKASLVAQVYGEAQVQPLPPQIHFAPHDPRHIQKVIHQPRQVP